MEKVFAEVLDGRSESAAVSKLTQVLELRHLVDVDWKDGRGWTCLAVAAAWGWPRMAEALLKAGAGSGARSRSGITPLHRGAAVGATSCVEKLLAFGASPLVEDDQGLRPVHYARDAGHEQVALRLEDLELRIE